MYPPSPRIPHSFLRNKPPLPQAALPRAQISKAGVAQHLQCDCELLRFPPGSFLALSSITEEKKLLIASLGRNRMGRKIKPVLLGTLPVILSPPCMLHLAVSLARDGHLAQPSSQPN